MSALVPPQDPPSWTHTPEEVTKINNELIEEDRKRMDKIAALPESECTFESVRHPYLLSMPRNDR